MAGIRRVVTGHDATGRAAVSIDETVELRDLRPRVEGRVIWTSESFPVDSTGEGDPAQEITVLPDGTVFRMVDSGRAMRSGCIEPRPSTTQW